MSQVALSALAIGLVYWIFAVIRQNLGANLYETFASNLATLCAVLLIIPSAFAEKGIRLWLILVALGLFCFFGVSTGDAAI